MPFKIQSGMDALVSITKSRNKACVNQSVLASIFDLIECDGLLLFRVNLTRQEAKLVSSHPKGCDLPSNIGCYITNAVGDTYAGIWALQNPLEVIIASESYQVDAEQHLAFFPSFVSQDMVDVICIHGFDTDETELDLLVAVISVYGHFMSVLEENERDMLTGLLNRKTFDMRLNDLSKRHETHTTPEIINNDKRLSPFDINNDIPTHWVGVLDIDFFKKINDAFGHVYGDEVLLLFSDLMRKVFRGNDLLFRFGGEEFVVFLLDVDQKGAEFAFERFRSELESYEFPQVGKVTVSIGITSARQGAHSATLLGQADKALYYAKEHGRNQVCNYHVLLEQGGVVECETTSDIDLF